MSGPGAVALDERNDRPVGHLQPAVLHCDRLTHRAVLADVVSVVNGMFGKLANLNRLASRVNGAAKSRRRNSILRRHCAERSMVRVCSPCGNGYCPAALGTLNGKSSSGPASAELTSCDSVHDCGYVHCRLVADFADALAN